MARYASAKKAAAAAAWRHIFDYILATASERVAVLERLRLTPAESRALISLDPDAGRSMRSLADAWSTDPSNATWVVDRLERRGLAKRVAKDCDRRVQDVLLTSKSTRVCNELLGSQYTPPPHLMGLPPRGPHAPLTATGKMTPWRA